MNGLLEAVGILLGLVLLLGILIFGEFALNWIGRTFPSFTTTVSYLAYCGPSLLILGIGIYSDSTLLCLFGLITGGSAVIVVAFDLKDGGKK